MNIPTPTSLSKCTLDMETEICSHGCNVEWKIYNFENRRSLTSNAMRPPGCDFSWQIYLSLEHKLIRVGVQLSDKKEGKLDFYNVVHITLQNTAGDVFYSEEFAQPSLPVSFQIGRPSRSRFLLIPNSDGKQFRLCQDDVLVVKAVILSKGCCAKNKEVQYKLEYEGSLD